MLPVVALVGRPNVGKSTLFNCLTQTRNAIVADQPGLTRDRQYGVSRLGATPFVVVDTGGLSGLQEGIDVLMEQQVSAALEEADHILFLVDARAGCLPDDEGILARLRKLGKPVHLVINKMDGVNPDVALADFAAMGVADSSSISASNRSGIRSLAERISGHLPFISETDAAEDEKSLRIAIVGRPNVGKSTLANRLLGEERVVTYDLPGTTRDTVELPMQHGDRSLTLIDTAGVRRRGKITDAVEKFSVIKALQAMESANVVFFVIDAREGVTDHDANLAGHVHQSGRALVLLMNKWDRISADEKHNLENTLERRLGFLSYAYRMNISALHGSGVGRLPGLAVKAFTAAMSDLSTSQLTRWLEAAVEAHAPPMVAGRRIRLRYAHQGGRNPPLIIVHGNQTEKLPAAYKRYLENHFRKALALRGTPVALEFRTGKNPFQGRRNKLTDRQQRKRARLRRHVRRQ